MTPPGDPPVDPTAGPTAGPTVGPTVGPATHHGRRTGEHGALRVLWLIKGLGPGGAEQLLVQQARAHDPDAVALAAFHLLPWKDHLADDLRAAGVPVRCLDARRTWDPRWLWRLRRTVTAHHPDVVHVHSPYVAAAVRLLLRSVPAARRPALVYTEHNRWPRHAPATRLANRATMHLDDVTLAVSDDVRATMPDRLARRAEVLIHGVDVDAVRAARAHRARVRTTLGLRDELVVGIVANLRREKAYDVLLDAAAALFATRPGAPVRFLSVGQGPLAGALAERHRQLGLDDRFRFLGYRDDPLEVLAAFDIFTLSSRHEGLPVALMEALAMGLPVVATDVGGITQAVTDGREALLVPPDDPAALAAAYLRLIDDAALRHRLAEAAGRRGDDFRVAPAQRRLEAIYRGAAAGRARHRSEA